MVTPFTLAVPYRFHSKGLGRGYWVLGRGLGMSHAWCSEALMLGVLMLGVLEVIGGKGGGDRCPGASARAGAARRALRCDRRLFAMKKRVCGSSLVVSLWSLIGVLSVSVIPPVSAQNSKHLHTKGFPITRPVAQLIFDPWVL